MTEFSIRNRVLRKYTGNGTDIVIPESVTIIGDNAFKGCNSITSISIPDGVEQINKSAFMNCESLASVRFPESLTVVGDSAFEGCKRLIEVLLPESVKTIGTKAFYYCLNMETITIPNGLESVGESAFGDCHSLVELCFPPKTVFLGPVIGGCWNLKRVILPETLSYFIPSESNKIECIVAPSVKIDGIYETSNKHNNKRFAAAVGYIKYTERYSEQEIRDSYNSYLFKRKKDLLPVVWKNDSVQILSILAQNGKITKKTIDNEYIQPAMKAEAMGCVSFLMDWKHKHLKESGITDDLLEIEKDPYRVTEMKKLWGYTELEDGTIKITHYKGAKSEITVPPRIGEVAVSRIGSYAFSPLMESAQGVCKKRPPKRIAEIKGIKSVIIPEGVTAIDKRAFFWKGIVSRPLIEQSALSSVVIPSSVKSIGDEAFSGCSSLVSITIPDSVTSIGWYAFYGCSSLSSISLPDSVTSIGWYAFSGCNNLTIIVGKGSYAKQYAKDNDIPFKYIEK